MAFFVGKPVVVGQPDDLHSSEVVPLGTVARDNSGNELIFLLGVASVAAGSWVTYDESFQAALIDTDTADTLKGPVAVAVGACVASTYGWFYRKGSCPAAAISGGGAADNAILYATSTAGSVDDVAVANCQIVGAVARSAESGGSLTVQLDNPWIGVDEAAA